MFFVQQTLKVRLWQLEKAEIVTFWSASVYERETVMIEEQVILNLQSLYSQECGLILRLSSMLHAPSRLLVLNISCGKKLLFNRVFCNNMRWAGLRVKAQRLFCTKMMQCFFGFPGLFFWGGCQAKSLLQATLWCNVVPSMSWTQLRQWRALLTGRLNWVETTHVSLQLSVKVFELSFILTWHKLFLLILTLNCT